MTAPGAETPSAGAIVHQGRRAEDWVVRLNRFNDGLFEAERGIFFWLFGMFLDQNHKPSMSRIMLAFWTWVGWQLVQHELHLRVGDPSIQNAVWTAWWAAEAALCTAVFAPSTWGTLIGAGGAASVAATALGTATRDALQRRETAAAKGEAGTEYTP